MRSPERGREADRRWKSGMFTDRRRQRGTLAERGTKGRFSERRRQRGRQAERGRKERAVRRRLRVVGVF